jgi:cysteinyl-tRNA synthetase
MSQRYLGESFDIHGGGKDLIFPHHENEIAQSEAASGKPFVRYWVHNGFVNINQEKMSKSLGNILAIRDLLRENHPEALRLFLLSSQYRSPVDFSSQHMAEANANLDRFYSALLGIEEFLSVQGRVSSPSVAGLKGAAKEVSEKVSTTRESFEEAMRDDFNTALALGYLHDLTRVLNRVLADKAFRKDPAAAALLSQGRDCLLTAGEVLGLFRVKPAEYFAEKRQRFLGAKGMKEEQVRDLIARRESARKEKNWTLADEIRREAATLGIALEDGPKGTTWRPI